LQCFEFYRNRFAFQLAKLWIFHNATFCIFNLQLSAKSTCKKHSGNRLAKSFIRAKIIVKVVLTCFNTLTACCSIIWVDSISADGVGIPSFARE
ncbi:hypothetical protein, partial [Acetobacterium wieringae]|uniref:hypothetical protein n=1 Tax=Acetobacterium wieringae TaxID=52694 RepID=UPI001FA704FE